MKTPSNINQQISFASAMSNNMARLPVPHPPLFYTINHMLLELRSVQTLNLTQQTEEEEDEQ
jgi:hypothetical protein